jgi:predicted alpha/beta hydrolase family esterase
MKIVYILVNGVLCLPGDADKWTDHGVTWIHTETDFRAEKFEYWSDIVTRRFRQQWRAEKLARMIRDFYHAKGFTVRLVGHSNGCDVILRAMKLIDHVIDEIHLISAACDENMETNRLLYYTSSGKVRKLSLYISGKDRALQFARVTEPMLKLFGLGYGWLGALDPDKLEAVFGTDATIIYEPEYGHSDWFDESTSNFDQTMNLITGKVKHEKVYADVIGDCCSVVG